MTDLPANSQDNLTLVLGGTGKTGRHVAKGLTKLKVPVRTASRTGSHAFDWNKPDTWSTCLAGVRSTYISYAPDLAVPAAPDTVRSFTDLAVNMGVQRLVLLSGRGEEQAELCENIVQQSGLEWTVLRASWFFQNFSEGEFAPLVRDGELALPAGAVREPFVDTRDVADVAIAALTENWHRSKVYELTGPRLLSFGDVAREISQATGRRVRYTPVSIARFKRNLALAGLPESMIWLLEYLFSSVLDGRNESVADGVHDALCRLPRDFSAFAADTVEAGIWQRKTTRKPGSATLDSRTHEPKEPRLHAY